MTRPHTHAHTNPSHPVVTPVHNHESSYSTVCTAHDPIFASQKQRLGHALVPKPDQTWLRPRFFFQATVISKHILDPTCDTKDTSFFPTKLFLNQEQHGSTWQKKNSDANISCVKCFSLVMVLKNMFKSEVQMLGFYEKSRSPLCWHSGGLCRVTTCSPLPHLLLKTFFPLSSLHKQKKTSQRKHSK